MPRGYGAAGLLIAGLVACAVPRGRAEEVAPRGGASLPPITIYRDAARYTTFPDVKRLSDGRLLCVFRDASFPKRVRHIEADARVVGALSEDHGRHWSKPFVVYDDPQCQNDPSVAVLRDGRLLLTFFNWRGLSEAYVSEHEPPYARRVDRGEWGVFAEPAGVHLLSGTSKPVTFIKEARPIGGTAERLRATSSSILETRQGTLLLPVYGRSPGHPVDQAYAYRSTDGGRTWSNEILIAVDAAGKVAMQEPALAQVSDGDIVVLMRTAHAKDHLYATRSGDDGVTWETPKRTDLIGHPPDLQVLPDGRLLAVYGYRHKPFGARACVSSDEGRTWDRSREIIIADTGVHTDLGYPSACLTDDGHVLVAYYMNGPKTKDRWIECRRIPLSMLD